MKLFSSRSTRVEDHHDDRDLSLNIPEYDILDAITQEKEILGIPRNLLPYYLAFALDAIAVGLVMPLLPFTVMELGANAFQLSLVVSSNYIAQSIGVTIMGRVSDTHGRKVVMMLCLLASSLSYIFLSRAESLIGVALARIISGSFGGLIPIIQSTVADSSSPIDRPKYLGRIMATFGLGFVLGPAISALLSVWSTRQKISLAGLLPFLGLLSIYFLAKETKKQTRPIDICIPFPLTFSSSAEKSIDQSPPVDTDPDISSSISSAQTILSPHSKGKKLWRSGSTPSINTNGQFSGNNIQAVGISSVAYNRSVSPSPLISRSISPSKSHLSAVSNSTAASINNTNISPTPFEIYLLVLNGFCIMFAFATETIYAMFIKDSFGYGEAVLSTIFAVNGMFIGLFQVFFIKPLISAIGKHATLAVGNILLAVGMFGVALIRTAQPMHFAFFSAHIVGYSIADTTVASLISKYSSPGTQGRDLALNQAAQACARVISPIVAGMLYEYSKRQSNALLPLGALPFLVGAFCPLIALSIPSYLYWQKRERKRRRVALFTDSGLNPPSANTFNKLRGYAQRWLQPHWQQQAMVNENTQNSSLATSGQRALSSDSLFYDFAVSSDSNSDTEGANIRSLH